MKKLFFKIIIIMYIFLCCNKIIANSVDVLKEIAGYDIATNSHANLNEKEVSTTILNDLINELRPFLSDVIDEDIEKNHNFSQTEVTKIIIGHPVKFVTAIYNYVKYSVKEIFGIALKNTVVEVE